jgi:peptidoglycan/xylan/chitin deacetylase (PgdA/CDA1 family)
VRLRRLRALVAVLALGTVGGPLTAIAAATPALASTTPTRPVIVSLTFDDGFASQINARSVLRSHGVHATFYVNSARVEGPGRLTWSDVHVLAGDGNEIGGHTLDHVNLTRVGAQEAQRQICDDRLTLTGQGFSVTDFAYPYGSSDPAVEAVAKRCGYNSARSTGGLAPRTSQCPRCHATESIPPRNAYHVRGADSVVTTTPMAALRTEISNAANAGGWVPLVFHEVCDDCSDLAVRPADLDALLTWLADQPHVEVRTVAQVIGGPARPLQPGPMDGRHSATLINSSLEDPSIDESSGRPDGATYCWEQTGYGHNAARWARVRDAQSGSWAESVTVSAHHDGDAKVLVKRDSGECAPAVTPGATYQLGAWYRSSARVRIVAFYRAGSGGWRYWTSSPFRDPANRWTAIEWATPSVPAGATRLSFGLSLADDGTLAVDSFAMRRSEHPPVIGASTVQAGAGLAALTLLSIAVPIGLRHQRVRRAQGEVATGPDAVIAASAPPGRSGWSAWRGGYS